MDWIQFVVMLGTFAGLFFWNRSEGRADQRLMLSLMQGIEANIRSIDKEMKDFHGRLCAIEERYRSKP